MFFRIGFIVTGIKEEQIIKNTVNCFLKISIAAMLAAGSVFVQGCAANNGVEKLTDIMYSQYAAEISFSLSDGTDAIEGNAVATKGDTVKISFLSPQSFEGMTIESDGMGGTGNIFFTYYGMRVPLPETIFTKLNLLMSFFADDTAVTIGALPQKEIHDLQYQAADETAEAKKCTFLTCGDISAELVYNPADGMPLEYSAALGIYTANIKFDNINNSTQ